MKLIYRLIITVILMFPVAAMAHGYWIELEGDHQPKTPLVIRLIFGEYILGEKLSGDKLDRMKEIRVMVLLPGGQKKIVEMKQQPGSWEGTFIPENEGTFTVVAINDEREVQDWTKHGLGVVRPVQYLQAAYQVGKKTTSLSTGSFLSIDIAKKDNDQYDAVLYKNKLPLAAQTITVVSPSGTEQELKTSDSGRISFGIKEKGLYLVGVEWIDTTPGIFKEKEYKTVRHKLDYSLYIE